jgi:hypothetical protein
MTGSLAVEDLSARIHDLVGRRRGIGGCRLRGGGGRLLRLCGPHAGSRQEERRHEGDGGRQDAGAGTAALTGSRHLIDSGLRTG